MNPGSPAASVIDTSKFYSNTQPATQQNKIAMNSITRKRLKTVIKVWRNIDSDTRFMKCFVHHIMMIFVLTKANLFVLFLCSFQMLVTRAGALRCRDDNMMNCTHEAPSRERRTGFQITLETPPIWYTHSFLNVWRYVSDSHCLNLRAIKLTRCRCRRCHVS